MRPDPETDVPRRICSCGAGQLVRSRNDRVKTGAKTTQEPLIAGQRAQRQLLTQVRPRNLPSVLERAGYVMDGAVPQNMPVSTPIGGLIERRPRQDGDRKNMKNAMSEPLEPVRFHDQWARYDRAHRIPRFRRAAYLGNS